MTTKKFTPTIKRGPRQTPCEINVTAPWQVVGLLVDGPVLSKEAALLEHDTLPPDPDPRKIPDGKQPVVAGTGGGS